MSVTNDKASLAIREAAGEWAARLGAVDLSHTDKVSFAAWLRASPVHVREYLNVEALRFAVGETVALDRTDVRALLGEEPSNVVELQADLPVSSRADSVPPRRMRTPFAVAAMVLFALGAALGLFYYGTFAANTYSTAVGETRRIALADGSTVELNTHSKIHIDFDERRRDIRLTQGEAFFTVARDARRPFTVTSGGASIRAVGTQFSVYRKPDGIMVTVVEGKVAARNEQTSLELVAGQQIVMASTAAKESAKVAQVDARRVTAWRQHRLIFDNQPLSEVIAEFNRYNRQQLVIEDPVLAAQGISGVFDPDKPQGLLLFLSRKGGVQAVRSPGDTLVLSRQQR